MFAAALAAVLYGNFLTVMFFYGLWRLKQNERDGYAIALVLFCLFMAGAAGLALRESSQAESAAQAHSAR